MQQLAVTSVAMSTLISDHDLGITKGKVFGIIV